MNVLPAIGPWIGRLGRWWADDLWSARQTAPGVSPPMLLAVYAARTVYIVATGFRTERIKLRAALLTYVTLLSIVPALVVMFSVLAAFQGLDGVQDGLKRFVVSALAVSHQDTVIQYIDSFNERAGTVGTFGVAVLLLTVISLLTNIEKAFNDIWGVRRGRSFVHRFQVYWPLVTLGPILVGLSLSLTAAFGASTAVKELVILTPVFNLVFKLLPLIFTWGFLTLLYVMLPNTHVPLRAALAGGVVAGTLWEAAKQLYALYAAFALSVPSVYGSLAAVPLFILWLYVSWVVALLGATLTFALQNAQTYEPESQREKRRTQHDRELLAVRLLFAVSDSFAAGKGPVPAQVLLDRVIVAPRFARRVLAELVDAGLLVETVSAGAEDPAYVPGRPLEALSIHDVIRVMRGVGAESEVVLAEDDRLGQRVRELLGQGEAAVEAALGSATLAAVLEEARPTDGARTVPGGHGRGLRR